MIGGLLERYPYQLNTAQTKLVTRVTSLRILLRSLSMMPSATSLIKLTSSSRRLLWPSTERFERTVLFASKSRVVILGPGEGEVGAMVAGAT